MDKFNTFEGQLYIEHYRQQSAFLFLLPFFCIFKSVYLKWFIHFNSNGENYKILNYCNNVLYITLLFNFLGGHASGMSTLNCQINSLRHSKCNGSLRVNYFWNTNNNLIDYFKMCKTSSIVNLIIYDRFQNLKKFPIRLYGIFPQFNKCKSLCSISYWWHAFSG